MKKIKFFGRLLCSCERLEVLNLGRIVVANHDAAMHVLAVECSKIELKVKADM